MKNITVNISITIKDAMKQLDLTAEKVLLIADDNNRLLGTLTDGDVRRAILSGRSLDDTIELIYNKRSISINKSTYTNEKAKALLLEKKIELIPIVDSDNVIIDYITWDRIFDTKETKILKIKETIDIPVVIMAGGKGTRLEPFTKVLPKPLIPIGDKTIIEHIMERFAEYGVKDFYFTLNYKGEMIKTYFENIDHNYNINYVYEKDFYGTAGSLKLLENEMPETFIVSNCDIIVKGDYSDIIKFHVNNNADLTVISSIQHHQIPYGVIRFIKDGVIEKIDEKPEQSYVINTGVYVINTKCLKLIPENQVFHMTDMVNALLEKNGKVFTYPVNENDYIDIGQWDEYRSAVNKLQV